MSGSSAILTDLSLENPEDKASRNCSPRFFALRHLRSSLVGALALFCVFACTKSRKNTTLNNEPKEYSLAPAPDENNTYHFSHDINHFSMLMHNAYAQQHSAQDFAVSPLSVYSILQMGYWGTPPENVTTLNSYRPIILRSSLANIADLNKNALAQHYAEFLQQLSVIEKGPEKGWENSFTISHNLYRHLGEELNPEFARLLNFLIPDLGENLDLGPANANNASTEINKWVSDSTQGMITELVSPRMIVEHQNLYAILLNAVVFNKHWYRNFILDKKFPFTGDNNKVKMIPGIKGMSAVKIYPATNAAQNSNAQVIALPFDDAYTSYLLLNSEPGNLANIENFIEQFKSTAGTEKFVMLPQFDIAMKEPVNLASILIDLGLSALFQRGSLGYLLKNRRDLHFQFLVHNAHFTLSTEGVKAAASTAGGAGTRSIISEPDEKIIFDHSFDFALVHQNTVIFTGHFGNNANNTEVSPSPGR